MAITRFAPYRDIVSLQSRLNSLFQDFNPSQADTKPAATAAFVPPVDVYEDENKVVLKLEVPGLKREEIDIQLDNHTLTVRGERKFEKEENRENFRRIERRYGSFYRAFTLPNTLNTEQVKADYDAGVLRVEVQKRAEARPRQIKVAIGSAAPVVENQPAA